MAAQKDLIRQRRSILWIFIFGVVIQIGISVFITHYNLGRELVDLASKSWILIPNIPKEDIEGRKKLEEKILQGACRTEDSQCGTWIKVKRAIDLSKIKAVEDRAYIIANAEIPINNDYVINLGDAYGEYSGWINGKYLGMTSRLQPLQEKKFLFTNTDALQIPKDAVSQTGESHIVLRADRWTAVDYPPFFRIYNFSIVEYNWFMFMETLTHLILVCASVSIFLFGMYHFAVWLKRRQASYFAFVFYCLSVCFQNGAVFGVSRFWGVPESVNLQTRLVLVSIMSIIYITFQLLVDAPLSYYYEYRKYLKDKAAGILAPEHEIPVFAGFGKLKKIVCIIGEFLFYIYMPLMIFVSIFLSQRALGIITYKLSVYIVILLNFGGLVAIMRWFWVNSIKKNIWYAVPAGFGALILGIGIIQTVIYNTFGIRLAGTPQGTVTAVLTIMGFAASLGHQFTLVYYRLGKLKARLETILSGTKELSSTHEKLAAATKAAKYVLDSIKPASSMSVKIALSGEKKELATEKKSDADKSEAEGEKVNIPSEVPAKECTSYLEAYLIKDNVETNKPNLELKNNPYLESIPNQKMAKGECWLFEGNIYMPIVYAEQSLGFLIFENYPDDIINQDDAHFIDTLSSSLGVSLANISFLHETAEKAKLDAELSAAQAVQKALLPENNQFPHFEIATVYRAAAQTGGDWFGYHYNENTHNVDVFIGDVTGHGISSALLTGVICGTIYSCERTISRVNNGTTISHAERLSALAEVANQLVLQTGKKSKLLMTMLFVSIDLETGKCVMLNAGHNPLYQLEKETTNVRVVPASGNRLGYQDKIGFKIKEFQIHPGDSLFMYTDGLIENTGPNKTNVLAERALKKLLVEASTMLDIKDAVDKIVRHADEIWQGQPPADDVSAFFCRWKGPITREQFKAQMANATCSPQ